MPRGGQFEYFSSVRDVRGHAEEFFVPVSSRYWVLARYWC